MYPRFPGPYILTNKIFAKDQRVRFMNNREVSLTNIRDPTSALNI